MSSIPLPALDVQIPKPDSLLNNAAEMEQIRASRQQQQAGELELQQKRMELADQQAMTQALHDWDGKDLNDLPGLVTKRGGSAKAVFGLRSSIVDQKTKLMALDKDQLALEAQKHDLVSGTLTPLTDPKQVPDEQLPAAIHSTVQDLVQRGLIDPQHAQSADALAQMAPDAARAQIGLFQKGMMGQKAQIEQAKNESETAKNTAVAGESQAKGVEAQASTAKTQLETQLMQKYGGASPAQLESRYLTVQMQQRRGQPVSPDDAAFVKSYEHMKTLVPAMNFNLQNAGATGTPNQPSPMAQAIANGTMKWQDAISPRTPMSVKNQMAQEVLKLNPNFDTSTFAIEQKAAEKATSGTWADTRVAYNTAIDHASQLLAAADALKNGDVKKLNSLGNYFKTEFGSPDVSNFNAIANAYNHEVTGVIAKGHITDAEVAAGHATLPDNASKDQIRGVAAAYKQLMMSKRDELDKVIKAGAGNKANGVLGVQSNGDKSGAAASDPFAQFGGKAR